MKKSVSTDQVCAGSSDHGPLPRMRTGCQVLRAIRLSPGIGTATSASSRWKRRPVLGVVVEDLGVASPVQRGLELALDFVGAEVLVENVAEELLADGVVALGVQRVLDEAQDGDVLERGLAEELLLRLDVGFAKLAAFRRDLDIAFVQHGKAQHHRRVYDGKQVVHVHRQLVGQLVEIVASAAVGQQLHESGNAAGTRMRQHLELGALARLAIARLRAALPGTAASSSGRVSVL